MAKPVVFGKWTFPTQAAATKAVQDTVNPHPLMEEFESELLSDLAALRHHHFSVVGLRPTRFRRAPNPHYGGASYEMQGFFPAQGAERAIGWRDFSWKACVRNKTPWEDVLGALRRLAKPRMDAERKSSCERCPASSPAVRLDVDHVNPTFDEIVKPLRPLISDEEALSYRNWEGEARYTLPAGHAIVLAFMAAHEKALLQTLCRPCHLEVARQRSQA